MRDHVRQAREFARLFGGEMGNDDRTVFTWFCEDVAGWSSVLGYALKPGVYRKRELDAFILRVVSVGLESKSGSRKGSPEDMGPSLPD